MVLFDLYPNKKTLEHKKTLTYCVNVSYIVYKRLLKTTAANLLLMLLR